ncbi:MAG: oxidoreductase [Peptococcaceae bacterium]|nr:oxidoreductase [Peptococcaceae bacterium]
MSKPKLAFFKLSSCAGCQLSVLNIEPVLLDVLGAIDITYFVMAKRSNYHGPYDIGFVEGAVTSPRELEELKNIRRECNLVVAMGTCACFGGIPSIKNFTGMTQRQMEEKVYSELWDIKSIPVQGIDYYIPVDHYLRGCPIDLEEFLTLVKSLLKGVNPHFRFHSVCNECKLNENICLLVNRGKACMGSVTASGCNALCPSLGRECEGCRGPASDCNAESLAKTFSKELGLDKADIVRKFRKYAGNTSEFSKGAGDNE